MADFDLFDLVGVAFDPPETNARQVKKKIDQKKAELGSALGRETQQTNRDALQAQIDYLDGIAIQILSPDGKKLIDSAFKPLADNKTAVELSSLSATVELLKLTGGHSVTEATIRHYKKESRLSIEHVKKAFTDAGFEIIDKDPLAAFPKFPTNADRIYSELAALRRTKDPNPNGADTSVVADLYSFAAYISNDTENIALYKAMDTKELWGIFDPASRRYSQRNDDLGKLCGSLSAAAKTYVFNSEENRAAYERHLVYRSVELTKLFSTMKKAPESTLLSSKFADSCIRIICNYFPDYEVALAIYNKEAGLTDDYYWPTSWVYTIKCSYCGAVSEFESETDAMKTNACKNCRKPLFKKCDKCGKTIPVFKDSCPHCGYVFASAALFSKFFQQAEAALRRNDFDTARQYLFQAQSAAPGEKARIDLLSSKIEKEEVVLKEPINKLRQLIAERKFYTARSELGKTIQKYPQLNVTEFERAIATELSKAESLYSSAISYSPSKKADVCVSILMQCVDYLPAIAFLKATAPSACANLTVSPSPKTGKISISWMRSYEQGITYRLVRNAGAKGASTENDGTILIKNTSVTSFTDEQAKPGILYTYSVFTEREDVYSAPVSGSGAVFADVFNCRIAQRGSAVRLTWDAPDNSRGATVKRVCDGKGTILAESAYGGAEDVDIQYGKNYTYTVFANYEKSKSPGIEMAITPMVIINFFTIKGSLSKDNIYNVSWSIKERGINLRIMANGKLVGEAKSEDDHVAVVLPRNSYCEIAVLAFSGGKWLQSDNSISVNTFSACAINKKASSLEEVLISGRNGDSYRIDLKIVLSNPIPNTVSGFYYTVRNAKAENRWASIDEIGKAQDIQRVSLDTYQKQGYILFQDFVLNETAFFISVFTVYSINGMEVLSEPQKMKMERPLMANLFWSVNYSVFDGLKLNVEIVGNRPIAYMPEMILCYCDSNEFISSPNDKNAQMIMRIESIEFDKPLKEYHYTYSIKTELTAKAIKKCKFFLFQDGVSTGDKIMLRWKQGFLGKV